MAILADLEKFLASDAGAIVKGSARGLKEYAKYKWKKGHYHVAFYHDEEGKEIERVNLTAAENEHLNNGGRLILVYGCGHRQALQF